MYDVTTYGYGESNPAVLASFGIGMYILCLVFAIIVIIATWKIFTKAGKPGWAAIVPFYNAYTQFEVAGMSGWFFLCMFIPVVNVVISIIMCINLAKAFGKSGGFAVGLILLPLIFYLILAFGSAQYVGTENK